MTRYAEWSQINMVIQDYERVYTVDVGTRYESRHNLNNAYQKNIMKYEDTAEFIKCANPTLTKDLPVVIGCRIGELESLGLSRSVALTAFLIALQW
jgi:hypothetical protein